MTESMREAFEEWVRTDPYFKYDDISLDYEDGCYLDCDAGRLFKAWCSSRSQPQQWIKCSDRLPDDEEIVWPWYPGDCHEFESGPCTGAFLKLVNREYRGAQWLPTNLKQPEPPKE